MNRSDLADIWHELVILGTVLLLIGTVGYLIYADATRGAERTYTQYDLTFAEDDVSELMVVPPTADCTPDNNLVTDTTDSTVHLDTGSATERTEIDDVLATQEFTFCIGTEQTTERTVLHEQPDNRLQLTFNQTTFTLVDRTIHATIIQ